MAKMPFTICKHCGAPQLDNDKLTLVIYFFTKEERDEFVAVFKECHPNTKCYPVVEDG